MRSTGRRKQTLQARRLANSGLRRHTFEQVVVVIVRPRRRHRQPVFAVGNRFQAGQPRPDESAERMRQAGAMRSGARGLLLAWGGWLRTPPLRTQDSGRTVSVRHLALRRLLFAARSLARGEIKAPGIKPGIKSRDCFDASCFDVVVFTKVFTGTRLTHGGVRGRNTLSLRSKKTFSESANLLNAKACAFGVP